VTSHGGNAATVEFDHVTKHYGSVEAKSGGTKGGETSQGRNPGAVNDLSLKVPAGKICVLVGPSGCGKTTSLKMVNRLIEPSSGRILLDGVDASSRDIIDLRRDIGYVIQQVGLFPHQTIEENVATVPRLLGWDKPRQMTRAAELLALVGLEPGKYARRYPAQLSGGERQRVGVARALAADPPIMLMDEPFGAVDPIVRERLQNEFLRLQEDLAKTILFVTHDIDEAVKMGDLVAVFQNGGEVAQFGTPTEILSQPASDFVARFVGTDRGLKRLSLFRVSDVSLEHVLTARTGDPIAPARARLAGQPFEYLLIVDEKNKPLGWAHRDRLGSIEEVTVDLADPSSPVLDRRTTLKDALSQLLEARVQVGLVADRTGALLGTLTVDRIADFARLQNISPTDTSSTDTSTVSDIGPEES
jgi:osmoprotectant transport system ATP-binding protein